MCGTFVMAFMLQKPSDQTATDSCLGASWNSRSRIAFGAAEKQAEGAEDDFEKTFDGAVVTIRLAAETLAVTR